jgi:arsenical pump membrane protein
MIARFDFNSYRFGDRRMPWNQIERQTCIPFQRSLMADTAAMSLITSNPINILSADIFKYSFIDNIVLMGPVAVAVILSSLLLFWLFFRKQIPKFYDVKAADKLTKGKPVISPLLLKMSLVTLIAIDVGYVLTSLNRFPVSIIICTGAAFLVTVYWFTLKWNGHVNNEKKGLVGLAKEINWDIVLFMFSIFLVVQGLETAGVANLLASALSAARKLPSALGIFAPSRVVTIGASFINNWPMTILGILSIQHIGATSSAFTGLIFSNIIGNNIGPHFFPLGSPRVIVIWLKTMKHKGVKISLKEYLKVGSVLSIAQVAIASFILWLELSVRFKLL